MRISIRTAIFSLVLSVMLWLSITLQAEYEVTVPVRLDIRLPRDRSLVSALPSQLYVKLRGTGWNLINALYLDRSTRIALDLPAAERAGLITEAELRAAFRSPVPLGVSSIEPARLEYRLDIIARKKVPLLPRVDLRTADGYVLTGPLVVVPDSVVVIGSQSVVDTIRRWTTVPYVQTDLRTNALELVETERSPIVRVLPEKVLVKGVVQQLAELTYYDVPVHVDAPLPQGAMIAPTCVTVTIRAGLGDIERILDQALPPITVHIGQQQLGVGAELITPHVDAPPWVHSAQLEPRYLVCRYVVGTLAVGSAIRREASP
jgi:hypothetical protein